MVWLHLNTVLLLTKMKRIILFLCVACSCWAQRFELVNGDTNTVYLYSPGSGLYIQPGESRDVSMWVAVHGDSIAFESGGTNSAVAFESFDVGSNNVTVYIGRESYTNWFGDRVTSDYVSADKSFGRGLFMGMSAAFAAAVAILFLRGAKGWFKSNITGGGD